jgi:hypothetical protein
VPLSKATNQLPVSTILQSEDPLTLVTNNEPLTTRRINY